MAYITYVYTYIHMYIYAYIYAYIYIIYICIFCMIFMGLSDGNKTRYDSWVCLKMVYAGDGRPIH